MSTYENEKRVVLLSAIKDKTESEKQEMYHIITSNVLDWGYISGVLVNNRLGGYFYNFMDEEQKRFILPEFMRTLRLISNAQNLLNQKIHELLQPIFTDMEDAHIKYAALKGLVYSMSIYPFSARRSNDCDVLVSEDDLNLLDSVLRKRGFIQSSDFGHTEATKKEKLIQRMNYHDLTPYVKRIDLELQDHIRIDINFHFDNKDNDITREILNLGTKIYERDHLKIRGLIPSSHFLHLCVHFYREASNTLWTDNRRDVLLYKVVDIMNTYRAMNQDEINECIELSRQFGLKKAFYFTFYYMNIFYPEPAFENIMNGYVIEEKDFLDKIKVEGKGIEVNREETFYDKAFTIKYCNEFYKKTV